MSGMNFTEILARLEAARENPKALALATLDICLAGREPLLARAITAGAIPHWFDANILRALLPDETFDAEKLLQDLAALPMVESFAARGGWNVHELTRLALRERLAHEEPARFAELSSLVAAYFGSDETVSQIERLYHRLGASPQDGAAELFALYESWRDAGRHESLQALGIALDELARTSHLSPTAEAQVKLRLGLIRESRLTTAERMVLARRALELFRQTGEVQGLIDALDFLGNTQATVGELEQALASRIESHGTAKVATQREPGNPRWLRELAVAHNKIGRVFQTQHKLDAALAEFQAHQRIMADLVALDPANTGWLRDLSVSHNYLGNVFQTQGKLDAALAEFQAYKRIMADLVALDPANTDWQRELAVSHNCVSNVFQTQGKLDAALADSQADKRITSDLVALDPANTGWQRDLAASHNCVGNVFQAQGKLDAALAERQESKRIMAELVALDPANTGWQQNLSTAHNNVGSILLAQDKLDKALAEFQAALLISKTLAALDPGNANWQEDLRIVQAWIASLQQRLAQR